jgi:hypothetical protein
MSRRDMSKGKYKRKRQRSQRAAQEETDESQLQSSKVLTAKEHQSASHNSDKNRNSELERTMGLGERLHILAGRSSLTDWIIAFFTLVLACAAIYQFIIMDNQLKEMRIDQRPWLAVKLHDLPPLTIGQMILSPASAEDIGKSAAFDIRGWVFFRPVPIGEPIDLSDPATKQNGGVIFSTSTTGVIYPNDPQPLPGHFVRMPIEPNALEHVLWTQALQDQWTAGTVYLAFDGKLTYRDAAGNPHWTTFCQTWKNPITLPLLDDDTRTRCANFNGMDRND